LLFVGDVGEEGLGDLRGIRHLFTKGRHRTRIRGFLTVDSPQVEGIVSGGVGSKRYRVTFQGPGGHSYAAFGLVNPMYAMAECARGLAAVKVPDSPPTTHCVSVVSGGTSINAIANRVVIEVDLRSASAAELAKLAQAFLVIVDLAVATENAARSTANGPITAEVTPVGDRPAGETPAGSPIRALAAAAVAAEGYHPSFEWSSTDANIPMSLGIPALKIGAGGRGGRASEWAASMSPSRARSPPSLMPSRVMFVSSTPAARSSPGRSPSAAAGWCRRAVTSCSRC
jgi:di/tripeptidase